MDNSTSTQISVNFANQTENIHEIVNMSVRASVFDILLEVSAVNFTYYGSLVFINAINNVWGHINISNYYWIYYVNGIRGSVAANTLYVENNDIILWSYEK